MPITWDGVGEKKFETGVDHGVLYIPDEDGVYADGVAWNGLTNVTESPSGAEQTKTYADNIVYGVLTSVEEFGATITCYTYPTEFEEFDGFASPSPGIKVGQQPRRPFGFAYRTRVGNDVAGDSLGYKLHLVYGCFATPSERSYATVNDSPEMTELSFELTSVPVPVTIDGDLSQTSILTIDSTEVDADDLQTLEDLLYGASGDPTLPTPDEVIAIFGAGLTEVDMGVFANQPSYNSGTHVITLPAVTGVQWQINGEDVSSGAQPALGVGETAEVEATPAAGYFISGDNDWTYDY